MESQNFGPWGQNSSFSLLDFGPCSPNIFTSSPLCVRPSLGPYSPFSDDQDDFKQGHIHSGGRQLEHLHLSRGHNLIHNGGEGDSTKLPADAYSETMSS
jgi:hypothetical protein